MYISKRSGMDHTVLHANTPCLPFLHMRSPDGATSNCGKRHPIAAYYSSINPKWMKGWVGLVGWPIADGLLTQVVTRQLQVERRTGKVRQPKTDVLPLCHATNKGLVGPGKHLLHIADCFGRILYRVYSTQYSQPSSWWWWWWWWWWWDADADVVQDGEGWSDWDENWETTCSQWNCRRRRPRQGKHHSIHLFTPCDKFYKVV